MRKALEKAVLPLTILAVKSGVEQEPSRGELAKLGTDMDTARRVAWYAGGMED